MAAVVQKPEDKPITLVRGDDLVFQCRVEADLTGYDHECGIYNGSLAAPDVEIEPDVVMTPVPTPTPPETVHTTFDITIENADTAILDPRKGWFWFLRTISAGGVKKTVFSGRVNVLQSAPASPLPP